MSFLQVTIVTNNVPAVGGETTETRCQGDMEKADMVDGKEIFVNLYINIYFFFSCDDLMSCSVTSWIQELKRVCAGRHLQKSTPTRPVNTRHCAYASRICSLSQVNYNLPACVLLHLHLCLRYEVIYLFGILRWLLQ